jgi:hypothetical protein
MLSSDRPIQHADLYSRLSLSGSARLAGYLFRFQIQSSDKFWVQRLQTRSRSRESTSVTSRALIVGCDGWGCSVFVASWQCLWNMCSAQRSHSVNFRGVWEFGIVIHAACILKLWRESCEFQCTLEKILYLDENRKEKIHSPLSYHQLAIKSCDFPKKRVAWIGN